jgi:hypothetical protein
MLNAEYGAIVPMENKIYCSGTTLSISPCNNHSRGTEVRKYGGTGKNDDHER